MASEASNAPSPPPTGDDGGGGGKGEEASAEEGALSLKPGLPIRGVRMKFAVLAGLVEVGEVSNRDIVETVFNLVSKYLFYKQILSPWIGNKTLKQEPCALLRRVMAFSMDRNTKFY